MNTTFLKSLTVTAVTCLISSSLFAQKGQMTVAIQKTSPSCAGASDGAISLNVDGGTPPYQFAWNNGANTSSISNITSGNFSVLITDSDQNQIGSFIEIVQPLPMTVSASVSNVTSNGGNDGSIDLTVQNSTGVNQFMWLTGNWPLSQNTEDVSGLASGNYTVIVTSEAGCVAIGNFAISQPPVTPSVPNHTERGISTFSSNVIIHETGDNILIRTEMNTSKVDIYDSKDNLVNGLNILPNGSDVQKIELEPGTYKVLFYNLKGGKSMKILKVLA